MDNPTISAPVEGLVFDNNESVNAVDANSTVTNNEPVFAVTKGSIGTAVGWTGSQIAEALADPKLHGIVKEVRGETDKEKQKQLKEQKTEKICVLRILKTMTFARRIY